MSSAYPSSAINSRDKGVRRPLGPINVNRADTNHSSSKAVVKPGHQRKLSNQSGSLDQSSSSSVTPRIVAVKPEKREAPSTSFEPLDESRSIFRATELESSESLHDMLCLQRANPVVETHESDESHHNPDEEVNALCFPFTRANQTIVYEPFDTRQMRSIFRRPFLQTSDLDDRMEKEGLALRLANAISEFDNDASEGDDNTPFSSGDRPQALDWNGLLAENTSILDMMS